MRRKMWPTSRLGGATAAALLTAAALWALGAGHQAHAYRPVVLIHGIMTGAASMQLIEDEIKLVRVGCVCVRVCSYVSV